MEQAADEISATLSLTRRAAERDLDLALSLTGRLRRVWQAFSDGRIDLRKVRILEQQLGHLGNEIGEQILGRVLDQAGDLTTGQLRARLARLAKDSIRKVSSSLSKRHSGSQARQLRQTRPHGHYCHPIHGTSGFGGHLRKGQADCHEPEERLRPEKSRSDVRRRGH
jgi:hypothetical protein